MSQSRAAHVAATAKTEFLSEQDVLARHYLTLELLVGGLGRRLNLPSTLSRPSRMTLSGTTRTSRPGRRTGRWSRPRFGRHSTSGRWGRRTARFGGGYRRPGGLPPAQLRMPAKPAHVHQSFADLCAEHGISP
jgi:hypothetical protein